MTENLTTKELHRHKLPTSVLAVDLTRDGRTAYSGCMDGVYRVDVASGEHERIATHDSYVSGVALLEDASQLITSGYDGVLIWHDLASGEWIRKVRAHNFWSWRMRVSPDGRLVASSTGQYLAGGYKYEPAAEREPSVRIFDVAPGALVHSLSHVPPVQSLAFSPDSRYVAAGNLMGEIRVWDLETGQQVARWSTPEFTSWGIIKSHCYIGGIYDLHFTPAGDELIATGMGPMRDPMAGNGKQTWQRFAWRQEPAKKSAEYQGGEGLMESLAFRPNHAHFAMAGRLRGGDWNAAFFDLESGELIHSLKTGCRITQARFTADGSRLVLAGTEGQPEKHPAKAEPFGRLDVLLVS
jgi:WD40 repeat protein